MSRLQTPVRKNDSVVVITGKDRGKRGRVLKILPAKNRLIVGFTVAENLILNSYWSPPFANGLNLDGEAIVANADAHVAEFDIRTPSINNDVGNLSGGNQQKVIAARELSRDGVKLVVAAQPTRGLDVGSIEYIHRRIVESRDAGAAVLIVSSELDEVMALADTIAVMYRGRIVGVLDPAEATFERLGLLMGGAHPEDDELPEDAARERAAAAPVGATPTADPDGATGRDD